MEKAGRAPEVQVPEGTDAASRAQRRTWRDRLNDDSFRRMLVGVLVTLVGGSFWGFSGTAASILFDVYHVDTLWLMSTRQILAGALFLIVILLFDRKRFVKLWTTPEHRRIQIVFTFCGLCANQLFYLLAVRLTNAGTATVLQCLQLVFIMGYTCLRVDAPLPAPTRARRARARVRRHLLDRHGRRYHAARHPAGGPRCGPAHRRGRVAHHHPARQDLREYGSTVVTGSGMALSGIVMSLIFQPWSHVPAFDANGWIVLAVFVFIGSFLAYLLYMHGVKEIGSVRASLIGTVEPVSATVTSALLLGTAFAGTDILGFGLIIAMVFLTV